MTELLGVPTKIEDVWTIKSEVKGSSTPGPAQTIPSLFVEVNPIVEDGEKEAMILSAVVVGV